MNSETTYLHLAATGDETSSEYECVFNEDILVKKDSKIALQSMSLNFNPNQIYIDGNNNTFFLSISGNDSFGAVSGTGQATSIQGQLPNGQYNATTLMSELTYQLNRTNTYTTSITVNVSKVEFNTLAVDGKINIQLARTIDDLNPPVTDYTSNNITVTVPASPGQNSFAKTAASADYSYAIYKPFWIRSRGSYRVRLPANVQGTIVGLVENIPDATVVSLPLNQYYLGVENIDTNYSIIFNGVVTAADPVLAPQNNDSIIFFIGEGKYKIAVSRNTGVTTIFEQAYTADTYKRYLHGGISILDATGTADEFRFTPSGLQLATIDGIHEISDVNEIETPNYLTNIGATPGPGGVARLTLTLSNGLRDLLGYQLNTYTSRLNTDTFAAVKNLDLISFPNAILVELVNVPLNSYDAVSRRRKNILGFLPGLEQTADTSNYYYVASEMVFINTKLFSDTLINSWRIRLTDRDGDVINIDPGKIAINIVVVSK